MRNTGLILILILFIVYSCDTNLSKTVDYLRGTDVSPQRHVVLTNKLGDSTVFYTIDGIKQGKATEYYKSGILKKEFYYKDGEFDSLCFEYWINGNLKTQTVFVNGKENGYQYGFLSNGKDVYSISFVIDGYGEVVSNHNANIEKSSTYSFYDISRDSTEIIGKLFFDSLGRIASEKSSYYIFKDNFVGRIPKYAANKKMNAEIIFFPIWENSVVNLSIRHSSNFDKSNYKEIVNQRIDADSLFTLERINRLKGWHFLRGEFVEELKSDNLKREVPIYFNYYVY